MDGRGGCCIARYSGSTGGGVYDMGKVDRIMLRFRPIAPKPSAVGDSVSPAANSEIYSKPGRGKRRSPNKKNNNSNSNCNGFNGNNKKRRNRKRRVSNEVTLPLLPQTTVSDVRHNGSSETCSKAVWLNFSKMDFGIPAAPTVVVTPPHAVVGCCVTVECMTETWVDGNCLGRTDEEQRANLAKDTCPGFISDGFEKVSWTNAAFRDIVSGGGDSAEMGVFLVMKDQPVLIYPAFTCRVRVQINGKEKSSLTLPCDVWRMNDGSWAWRLDLTAALQLGPAWLRFG